MKIEGNESSNETGGQSEAIDSNEPAEVGDYRSMMLNSASEFEEGEEVSTTEDEEGQAQAAEKQIQEQEINEQNFLEQLGKVPIEVQENPEFLKYVNDLGAIHKGAPIQIKDMAQLKELIQQGHDYSYKTMAHAEQVRTFEKQVLEAKELFSARENEFSEKIKGYDQLSTSQQILGALFEELAQSDPELFQQLDSRYRALEAHAGLGQANGERYNKKITELESKLESITKAEKNKEFETIRNEWNTGWGTIEKDHVPRMAKLGVPVDMARVQEKWMSDPSGKMTVQQALYAVHGEAINKALMAKQNVLQAKNKVMQKRVYRSGAGSSSSEGGARNNVAAGDYATILRMASKQL